MITSRRKMSTFSLAMVVFISTFGFPNIAMNYQQNGISVASMFLFISIFFFIPLVLIMAELAVFNKNKIAGLYSWVECSAGKNLAFITAWSFFVAQIFYLPVLAGRVPILFSYAFTGRNIFADWSSLSLAFLTFSIILLANIVLVYGRKFFSLISNTVGNLSLCLALTFIFLAFYLH